MNEDDEPPTERKKGYFSVGTVSKSGNKRIILSPLEREFEPPKGLKLRGKLKDFRRKGVINPTGVVRAGFGRASLFPRLVYEDGGEEYSCILKREIFIEGKEVFINPEEQVILQAQTSTRKKPSHCDKGEEDLRIAKINGEKVYHGFSVCFDGFNARARYIRTFKKTPRNFSKWEQFGCFFPNILAQKAINTVGIKRYEEAWEKGYGERTINDARNKRDDIPKNIFLSTKDCCPFPEKVWKNFGDGRKKYYASIIRFLPDIQVIYFEDFRQLANREYAEHVVKNLADFAMMEREFPWEASHIGLGAAPVKIKEGKFKGQYLMPYHGVVMNGGRCYSGGEVIVSRKDPQQIIERPENPVLYATEPWEKNGEVEGNIVFPTFYMVHKGDAKDEHLIHCFYGASDTYTVHTTKPIEEILQPFN